MIWKKNEWQRIITFFTGAETIAAYERKDEPISYGTDKDCE